MADNAQALDIVVDFSCRLQPGNGAADESGARGNWRYHEWQRLVIERKRFRCRRRGFGPNTRSASGDDLHVISAHADLPR